MKTDANGASIALRQGRTELIVDAASGSILALDDTVSGERHVDAAVGGRDDGRLFRAIIPGDTWWSRYADSHRQQTVRCEREHNALRLFYPSLTTADGAETGVSARVDIFASDRLDELCFTMHVENRGDATVLDTIFPLVGGWRDPGDGQRIAMGANSFVSPRLLTASAGNNYARNGRRGGWHYPVQLACPWADMPSRAGGLGYINYMTEGLNGKFCMENMAGYGDDFRLMFGWCHFLALPPGGTWSSPPIGLSAHDWDWHATADRYRIWFDQMHPPDYSRSTIRNRIGFQNTFFRGFDGTPIRPLEDIPRVAAAGRRYGVDLLCVWDMLTLGNYARHDPHDLTDYSEVERALVKQGLRQAEADGTSTCALTNFRHPNVALHLPDPALRDRVQRRYTGTPRTENWTGNHTLGEFWAKHIGPESYVFSPFAEGHRERVEAITNDYLDLGYSSMFYDQPFEMHPDYGFGDEGHPPDTTHAAALELVERVRRMLLARHPDSIVIGEESDIHATPVIDQWMSWSIAAPSPALLERLTLMRYSMPHTILSWVVDHEPERATLAFALGMQLCIMVHGGESTLEDEPVFAEHVRALARLRRQTAERTVMARFRGQCGLDIDAGEGLVANAYDSPAGPAVIVAANGTKAKGRVTLDPDAFQGAPAGDGRIIGLDGSIAAQSGLTTAFDLAENDVVVWLP